MLRTENKAGCGVLMAALASFALAAACGDTTKKVEKAECGEGTERVDGACEPVDSNEKPPCGKGTVLKDGTCVLDEKAAGELLKPKVQSVTLDSLEIPAEGERPVIAQHPLEASATFTIKADEAVDTFAVLGLESADGSKNCVVGQWGIDTSEQGDSQGSDEKQGNSQGSDGKQGNSKGSDGKQGNSQGSDGKQGNSQQIHVSDEFYVQKGCESLAGETDASAWVAFDPFGRTRLDGRTIEKTDDDGKQLSKIDIIRQSELSLDACKAGDQSPHPDSCKTSLEVKASPGKDIAMNDMTLGSKVGVIQYIKDNPADSMPASSGSYKDPATGKTIKTVGADNTEIRDPRDKSPHFSVTSNLLVYGQDNDADGTGKVQKGDVGLSFAIRPVIEDRDSSDTSNGDDDPLGWAPLTAKYHRPPKRAGGEPTLEELEKEFLQGIAGPTEVHKSSPIYISDFKDDNGNRHDVYSRILDGIWSNFDRFEVRVCAGSDQIKEAGVGDKPKANNCRIETVVVLREPVDDATVKSPDSEGSGYAPSREKKETWNEPWSKTWGTGGIADVTLSIGTSGEASDAKYQNFVMTEGSASAKLSGYAYNGTLANFEVVAEDLIEKPDDKGRISFSAFGIRLLHGVKDPLPDGETSAEDLGVKLPEYTQKIAGQSYEFDAPLVGSIAVSFEITEVLGMEVTMNKRASGPPEYDSNGVVKTGGDIRYKIYKKAKSFWQAQGSCRDKGGRLAAPYKDTATTFFKSTKSKVYWIGAHSKCGSPKKIERNLTDPKTLSKYQKYCIPPFTDEEKEERNEASLHPIKGYCRKKKKNFERKKRALEKCKKNFTDPDNWVRTGWEDGSVITKGVQFRHSEPNDHGSGEDALAAYKDEGLIDMPKSANLAYVCEFRREGGRVSTSAGPFAEVSASGFGGVDTFAGSAGVNANFSVVKFSVPLTGGVEYTPINNDTEFTPFANVKAELESPGGSVSADIEPFWGSSYGWTIFKLDGFKMAEIQLWNKEW